MTTSDILEHWASIYRPLSHDPKAKKLEKQSFFRIRYIDLENIFSRNANLVHSPCMLQSVVSTGELKSARTAEISHQVWLLAKVKDSVQTIGRFDGVKLEQTANDLLGYCEDLVAWLIEVKRTGRCPVTSRSFTDDPQLAKELQGIDVESINYGLVADLYNGQWLVAGVNWNTSRPLYNFSCKAESKYYLPEMDEEPEEEDAAAESSHSESTNETATE